MEIEHTEKVFIGMDLHKNTSTFSVKDKEGKVLDKRRIATEPDQVKGYLKKYRGSSLVLEPVSQWYYYADLIESLGIDVRIAHPLRVRAIASAKVKTDDIDAGVLCDLLRTDFLPEAYHAPASVRSWKEVVRARASLVELRTQVRNRTHSILFKNALRSPYGDLFCQRGRAWLEALDLPDHFASQLKRYLAIFDELNVRIAEVDQEIKERVSDHPEAKLLTTIPGISYQSALTIMGEIGDVRRFSSPKKLMGYAGLVPATYSSGGKTRHGKITKTGSKWLRWTLVEAAHRQQVCKKVEGLGWYFSRKKQTKGTNTAAVATARKLCAVIWRMLTDNRPFEERLPDDAGKSKMLTDYLSSPA